MLLPLRPDDGLEAWQTEPQREAIRRVRDDLESGRWTLVENPCWCGGGSPSLDVILGDGDMYGLPLQFVLCLECGLLRAKDRMDDASMNSFYQRDYRAIYSAHTSDDDLFRSQAARGAGFRDRLASLGQLGQRGVVLEVGCGLGGILSAFRNEASHLVGVELDAGVGALARERGIEVHLGELADAAIGAQSVDLLIMSHVLEHFPSPEAPFIGAISKLRDGGVMIVEVPGALYRSPTRGYPAAEAQLAHIVQFFHAAFLERFYTAFGLEILFLDQRCTAVLRRPSCWSPPPKIRIDTDGLSRWAMIVGARTVGAHHASRALRVPRRAAGAVLRWGGLRPPLQPKPERTSSPDEAGRSVTEARGPMSNHAPPGGGTDC